MEINVLVKENKYERSKAKTLKNIMGKLLKKENHN